MTTAMHRQPGKARPTANHPYAPPLRDMRFVLEELAGLATIARLPGCGELTPDLVAAILDEAGKLASGVLAPLNAVGDMEGAHWDHGQVTTASGFAAAHRALVDGGWCGLRCDPAYGGQGMPHLVALPVDEMFSAANMAFALSQALNMAAVEALHAGGSEALKARYLPRLVSGEWAGTMCLTEPQAGSDLSALRTRAMPDGEAYRLHGQKIFITWGEHDLTDNIIHLVLARIQGAPEGVRGISLFLVPKFLVNEDGTPGARNDVACLSIERKLGIHGSPTAVMAFGGNANGDGAGAVGYLVGQEHRGLETMFIMMNLSRLNSGLQGAAIGERAYQAALAYARGRVQGSTAGQKSGARVPILNHPDVRRMLMTMKALTEAMRSVAYVTAGLLDIAGRHADAAVRERQRSIAELLTPVVKGWCSETGQEVAALALQVHGGAGFIEETGVAQYSRDIRISSIYEGTTGIQANDLVGRKLARDQGQAMGGLLDLMQADLASLQASPHPDCRACASLLAQALQRLREATHTLCSAVREDAARAAAVAVPFLQLLGYSCGAWQMGRALAVAVAKLAGSTGDTGDTGDTAFYSAKQATARFYMQHILPRTLALHAVVQHGAASVLAVRDEDL